MGLHVSGLRTKRLRAILAESGLLSSAKGSSAPRVHDLSSGSRDQIARVFDALGGARDAKPLAPGGWDFSLADGTVLELDEQAHFHRYRASTLQLPFAQKLPWTGDYVTYCADYEGRAPHGGGYWSNRWSDAMFVASDPPKQFGRYGSSRWKQRAVYDALKDAAAHDGIVRLARISIYDEVDGQSLERILFGRTRIATSALEELIRVRTTA